jgi:predicted nucleic acid-binding protein
VIVVDASVLIAHLDDGDALHARAGDALLEVAHKSLGCSSITLAEVLVGPARRDRLDAARAAVSELGVAEIPLGHEAPARLASLRASSGLKLPDCCVLLAAQDAEAEAVLTFDDALAREVRRLGLHTPADPFSGPRRPAP